MATRFKEKGEKPPSVTTVDSDAKYGEDSKREEHSHKFGDYYLPLLRYLNASHLLSALPSPCCYQSLCGRDLINKTPSNTDLLPKTTK
ncbi:hypothetical protein CMV_028007 [Castanea mollissima]|uniref:Uncharacterized protein n=1 Tax=Castanea mollissima TaxID=60419 RepID=A0A8J4QIE8_9ROSI|nr:hypothetical protein CMV_028007 [Castanea mollissima]